jgi:hypothetical protein
MNRTKHALGVDDQSDRRTLPRKQPSAIFPLTTEQETGIVTP